MKLNVTRMLLLWLLLGVVACLRAEESVAARVIVLANSGDEESLGLARAYAKKREVPMVNIIALPMPAEETISWRQFIDTIYQPLQDELIKRGWIDAATTTIVDKIGRKKYAISGHRITYLVVCRGVPLRINHDAALYAEALPFTRQPEMRTNCGSVDGELSLLAQSSYPINAFVLNPLFHNDHPSFLDEARVVRVARLDGPSYAEAGALVDRALAAEKFGLIGRAYVDVGGPHPDGDKWLEVTAQEIGRFGMDLTVDRRPEVFPAAARFDAPVLYFGWHAGELNGPFAQPEFRFPPGAIALHIHSYSASSLRSVHSGWCGPLVTRGVTATFGNVFEPYLRLTHHPELLLQALVAGKTLGEAAYYALPALSWQEVVIGDPLYRPFGRSFAEQWQDRGTLPDDLFPYVVSREAGLLEQSGQLAQARRVVVEALHERPGLVLAVRAAGLCVATGDRDAALRALDSVVLTATLPPSLVPVAAQAAQFYGENGAPGKACAVYRTLLGIETLSQEQRLALLPPAIVAAKQAGETESAGAWARALEALSGGATSAEKNSATADGSR